MRCWICLTAGHGLRRSEAILICPANFNAEEKNITFRIPKTESNSTLPASAELRAYFELVQPVDNVNTPLVALLYGKKLKRQAIDRAWNRLKKKAGVNPQLRIHDLRRTIAVRTYRETKDLMAVKKILGHKQLISTLRYIEFVDPANIRPVIEQLRGGAPWKN
jgi:integrase